jgi:hypothetical protein
MGARLVMPAMIPQFAYWCEPGGKVGASQS